MSAIKLPVHACEQSGHGGLLWSVRDADNFRIVVDLFEGQAKQIALALNWHDDFVGALREIATSKGKLTVRQVRNVAQQVLARSQQPRP